MPKSNLPSYAIVELLMRLEAFTASIGSYKDHNVQADLVKVKTTGGIVVFPKALVMQQFKAPELVTDADLLEILSSFIPGRKEVLKFK